MRPAIVIVGVLLALAACTSEPGPRAARTTAAESTAAETRLTRELLFVGRSQGRPLVASIAFRSFDVDSLRAREIRGWLARDSRWETFLDERWTASAVGSAWMVVPHGDLRMAAGGPTGVEALWFDRGARRLRLRIGEVLGQWNRGATTRIHLMAAALNVGGDPTQGVVVELLRVRRPAEEEPGVSQQLILTSGDSLVLLVDRAVGRGREPGALVWLRDGEGPREWTDVRVQTSGGRLLLDARREIPRRWTVTVAEAGLRVDVRGLGFAAEVGEERAGRREVEARYTVSGWIERDGRRTAVSGLARYGID
jgi:hypothetical protein